MGRKSRIKKNNRRKAANPAPGDVIETVLLKAGVRNKNGTVFTREALLVIAAQDPTAMRVVGSKLIGRIRCKAAPIR